jgi:hypothetical protein
MLWSAEMQRAFLTLTYNQQRDLHDFYCPAKDLTDAELLAHRETITKQWPNLPQRAGKAYRKAERIYLEAMRIADGDEAIFTAYMRSKEHHFVGKPDRKGRRITLAPLARPDLDARAIAKAVLALANELTQNPDLADALPAARRTRPQGVPSAGTAGPHRRQHRPPRAKSRRRRAPQPPTPPPDRASDPADADQAPPPDAAA